MDSKASSTVPDGMKKSTRAQDSSKLTPPQQSLHRKRFSPEEKCYLAHHVNQCYDFRELCQMFNLKFGTDRTLESIEKFMSKCQDNQFFDLTEQAQDYKWCTPHPMSPVVPPSMVLGTAEWRTELRAFLVFQANKKVAFAALKESLSATFPEESRTDKQIQYHLAQINRNPILMRQLDWFSASYRWHPLHVAPAGAAQARTKASKAAARARLNKGKEKAKGYDNNQAATATQQGLVNRPTASEEASLAEQRMLVVQHTNIFGCIFMGSGISSTPLAAAVTTPLATTISGPTTALPITSSISEPHDTAVSAAASPCPKPTIDDVTFKPATISGSGLPQASPSLSAEPLQPTVNIANVTAALSPSKASGAVPLKAATDTGSIPSDRARIPTLGPLHRPGHAAGRARSTSPAGDDTRGEGEVRKERARSR